MLLIDKYIRFLLYTYVPVKLVVFFLHTHFDQHYK